MKKLLLSALAICAFSFANAQEEEETSTGIDVTFGAKAGLNLANLAEDFKRDAYAITFHAGGMAEISFCEKFAIQPELLFSIQEVMSDQYNSMLSYINLPVMAKYFVTEEISIEAGPQIGLLIPLESGDKDYLSSTDFGLNLGAGYKMESGLNFGLRYNFGLSNIVDDGRTDAKNSIMQFSVGYFFN